MTKTSTAPRRAATPSVPAPFDAEAERDNLAAHNARFTLSEEGANTPLCQDMTFGAEWAAAVSISGSQVLRHIQCVADIATGVRLIMQLQQTEDCRDDERDLADSLTEAERPLLHRADHGLLRRMAMASLDLLTEDGDSFARIIRKLAKERREA